MTEVYKQGMDELVESCCKMPDPIPLDNRVEILDPFPVDLLPKVVSSAVKEYQDYGQQPISIVATSAIAAMSVACQGVANVARDDRLTSPISLNFLVIAESGERKTTVDSVFFKPLYEWEKAQREIKANEVKRSIARYDAWVEKYEGVKRKVRQHPNDAFELERQLEELKRSEPPVKMFPRLFYEETTAEALAENLAKGFPSCALRSDEAGIVIGSHSMNKDNMLKTITLFNRLWDGNPYHVDRKSVSSLRVEDVRFTTYLMMQPEVFQQFVGKCGNIARHSGFLARCLVACPETTVGKRMYKEPPRELPRLAVFHKRIDEIINGVSLTEKSKLEFRKLQLSGEAKSIWVCFYNETEMESANDGEFDLLKDFVSKIAEHAARLAAVFHVFKGGNGDLISSETMKRAIGVITWYLGQARNIVNGISLLPEYKYAKTLLNWLIEKKCKTYPIADISRKGPNSVRKKERRDAALEVLAKHFYIEIGDAVVVVNPKVWGSDDV